MHQVRRAVRTALSQLARGSTVLVAGSGGPDSTALASAVAYAAAPLGLHAGFVCVDHRWSSGSAGIAEGARALAERLGLQPAAVLTAPATRTEGQARDARRALLEEAAQQHDASAVLLGHTLDDQAETVLLGLARGSGARSLAGMAPRSGLWWRPLLGVRREVLRAYCEELHLPVWDDPANADPRHARSRVRHEALPTLERVLGPGIAEALARSAELLRADADALDLWAERVPDAAAGLETAALQVLPAAVRTRVLRRAALAAGCPPAQLSAAHVAALDALVTGWHGQGPLDLPGPVTAARRGGRIELAPSARAAEGAAPPAHPHRAPSKRGLTPHE